MGRLSKRIHDSELELSYSKVNMDNTGPSWEHKLGEVVTNHPLHRCIKFDFRQDYSPL